MMTKHQANGVAAKRMIVNGKRVVQMDEAEFDRLLRKADEWEPTLPLPDADGNYPAVEYACLSLAIDLIRHRRRLGLGQAELAKLAGIRLETLRRIEEGVRRPASVRTIDKIEQALKTAEARQSRGR